MVSQIKSYDHDRKGKKLYLLYYFLYNLYFTKKKRNQIKNFSIKIRFFKEAK